MSDGYRPSENPDLMAEIAAACTKMDVVEKINDFFFKHYTDTRAMRNGAGELEMTDEYLQSVLTEFQVSVGNWQMQLLEAEGSLKSD